jgi:WD repeat-containing protein 23
MIFKSVLIEMFFHCIIVIYLISVRNDISNKLKGDVSVMTYSGHMVKHTLIRCHFSPSFTTGQRYIYTGCASGQVVIYDVITGEVVKRLSSECSACVRDVSWHPTEVGTIVSSTWDGTIQLWSYNERPNYKEPSRTSRAQYFNFW